MNSSNKGLVLILTGNGKGKSSSAFGMIIRSLGWKRKVLLVQFLKGLWETGEMDFFNSLNSPYMHTLNAKCPFTWKSENKEKDAAVCIEVWNEALRKIESEHYDLVVFDEIMIALEQGYLNLETVESFIKNRPPELDIVLTGRSAPEKLIALSDTVSEIRHIKHAFDKGITAKKGIDF